MLRIASISKLFKGVLTLVILLTVISNAAVSQQLPQFSQYMFNGLHINPAYAGYKNEGYIQSTYRSQWTNMPGAPRTFTVTADLSANEGLMGFGASFLSDEIGPTTTSTALLTYAYRVQTGTSSFLGLGISGGASQYSIDRSRLNPNDMDDVLLMDGIDNLMTPNLNAGVFFHNDRFYAGFSTYNMVGRRILQREDISLAYHDLHFYLTAGALFDIQDNVQFKPSFLIRQVKGTPTSYDINGMFLFLDRLWMGASYRSNMHLMSENLDSNLNRRNTVAFITEIFATESIRIGYAYDHNLNVLQNYSNNSHEISVGIYLSSRNVRVQNSRWF